MADLRRFAPIPVLLLALASAAITYPRSWSWIRDQHDSFQGLSSPTVVFKYQQLLPEEAVAFADARLHAKERYFVVARDAFYAPGVSYATAVRTFTRYALLPAVQVQDPQDADAVVGVGADPGTVGLTYSKVDWDPNGTVVVAQVKR